MFDVATIPAEYQQIAATCKAEEITIGGKTVIGIKDMRDLHAALKVKTPYRHWIKRKLENNPEFTEGVDFIGGHFCPPTESNTYDGTDTAKTISGTLDCSKRLTMLEKGEVGATARGYFIWCESAVTGRPGGQMSREEICGSLDFRSQIGSTSLGTTSLYGVLSQPLPGWELCAQP